MEKFLMIKKREGGCRGQSKSKKMKTAAITTKTTRFENCSLFLFDFAIIC